MTPPRDIATRIARARATPRPVATELLELVCGSVLAKQQVNSYASNFISPLVQTSPGIFL